MVPYYARAFICRERAVSHLYGTYVVGTNLPTYSLQQQYSTIGTVPYQTIVVGIILCLPYIHHPYIIIIHTSLHHSAS